MATRFKDPLDTLLGFQRALETAMTNDWLGLGTSSRGAFPPINVFQDGDDFVVIAEIPGVARDQIDVQVHRNQIRVRGKKTIDYGTNISVHRRERDSGNFDRTLAIPFQIDAESVKAECRDGLLALHVTRAERDKPKTISVS